MATTTQYPDIERAANTILAQQAGWGQRRELIAWVQKISADPTFAERLDRATADAVVNHRFIVTDAAYWAERLGCSEADAAAETDLIGTQWPDAFARGAEDALYRLADAVIDFRLAGRPSGDTTSEIMGLGAPLAIVTTSLAAAVAEYVSNLTNTWAQAVEDAEDKSALE